MLKLLILAVIFGLGVYVGGKYSQQEPWKSYFNKYTPHVENQVGEVKKHTKKIPTPVLGAAGNLSPF